MGFLFALSGSKKRECPVHPKAESLAAIRFCAVNCVAKHSFQPQRLYFLSKNVLSDDRLSSSMVALDVGVDYNSGSRACESAAYFGSLQQFSKYEQQVCSATLAELSRKLSSLTCIAISPPGPVDHNSITF